MSPTELESLESLYIDKKQAIRFLGISLATLNRAIETRSLTYYKVFGRVRFKKEDLVKFVEKGKVRAS